MKKTFLRKAAPRILVLLALTICIFYLDRPQRASAFTETCQQKCDAIAETCETRCMNTGGNVKICVEVCEAELTACLDACKE